MKFSDRSISYKSHSPHIELTQSEIGDKYSGTNCRQKYLRHIRATEPRIALNYGEVGCCTGAPEDAEAMLQKHAQTATSNEATLTESSRQQVLEELHNIHLSNIRRNLEHRLQVAREKGDLHLIRLLEAEFEQIA